MIQEIAMLPGGASSPSGSSVKTLIRWLRLHLAGLYHPEIHDLLLERFQDPTRLFDLDRPAARSALPVPDRLLERIFDPEWQRAAEREAVFCGRNGVQVLRRGSAGWFEILSGLPLMPLLLFTQGRAGEGNERAVAVIGSRRPSAYG